MTNVIVAGARTPIGKLSGALKDFTAMDLGGIAIKGALERAGVTGDQVDMLLDALPSALPFIKTNRLVPIVITGTGRIKDLPNVPTFAEVGLARVNVMSHWGILGPKALPREIVDKINAATKRAVQDPKVKQRLEDSGALVVAGSPQEFG